MHNDWYQAVLDASVTAWDMPESERTSYLAELERSNAALKLAVESRLSKVRVSLVASGDLGRGSGGGGMGVAAAIGSRPSGTPKRITAPRVLIEMIKVDQHERGRAGSPLSLDSYLEKFPALRSFPGAVEELISSELASWGLVEPKPSIAVLSDATVLTPRTPDTVVFNSFHGTARFELIKELGAGGMGVVYEVRERATGATMALKLLPPDRFAGLYRFKQEFRAIAQVIHPNLVRLYELVADDNRWYFTMELVEGVTFMRWVQPARKPSAPANADDATVEVIQLELADIDRLRSALVQLVEAVLAIHKAGHLHRDIKPSNVLVRADGAVKLLDFGLVTALEADHPGVMDDHTDERHIVGTVAYMSPEQAACQPLSSAADWYSIGVMLFEALTGQLPFDGTHEEILAQKKSKDAPSAGMLARGVPPDLEALCHDLLLRNANSRPTGEQILDRLLPGASRATPQDADEAPFTGRKTQIALLSDAFQGVRRGETVMIALHGRSGEGKSTLVAEFIGRVPPGTIVLQGRCYEQESVPFKALDSVVDALTRHLLRLSGSEVEIVMPRDIAALAHVFPVIERVPTVATAVLRSRVSADPQELRRRAFMGLREMLQRMGDRSPMILVIDDLQWGDTDSAAVLAGLLRSADAPRLLFLACYRSEHAHTSPSLVALRAVQKSGGRCVFKELEVGPLAPDEATALALHLLGEGREAQAGRIAVESGGNAYFVQELARHLRTAPPTAATADAAQNTTQSSQLLDDVLWNRVEKLPPKAKDLLTVIATAGQPIPRRLASRVANVESSEQECILHLRTQRLIRGMGSGHDNELETYHDRIRENVVAHIDDRALGSLHKRLAGALEESGAGDPQSIAAHYERGGDAESAGRVFAIAGEQAAAALAFDNAAELFRRSLRLRPLGAVEDRALRMKLADALANAGRGAEAAKEYLSCESDAPEQEKVELLRRSAYQLSVSGHLDEGRGVLQRLLGHVQMKLPETKWQTVAALVGSQIRLKLRGLKYIERTPDQIPPQAMFKNDIMWAASAGVSMSNILGGSAHHTKTLIDALNLGDPYRMVRSLAWEAAHNSNNGIGALPLTRRLISEATSLLPRVEAGNAHGHAEGMVTMARGIADFTSGRWADSCRLLDEAEAIFRERCTGAQWEIDTTRAFCLWALTYRGQLKEMARRSAMYLKDAQDRNNQYVISTLETFMTGWTHLADDNPAAVMPAINRGLDGWSRRGYHLQHLCAFWCTVWLHLYQRDGRAAVDECSRQWASNDLYYRVQMMRCFMHHFRGGSYVALADTCGDASMAKTALSSAEKDAVKLERENQPYAPPMAASIRAGIAAGRGDSQGALRALTAAISGFRATGMEMHALAAEMRYAVLVGGERGTSLSEFAKKQMRDLGARNPNVMVNLHMPGFGGTPGGGPGETRK